MVCIQHLRVDLTLLMERGDNCPFNQRKNWFQKKISRRAEHGWHHASTLNCPSSSVQKTAANSTFCAAGHSANSIGSNEKSGRTDGRVIGGHGNRFIWPDSGHDGRQRNQKVGRPSIDLPTTTETVIRKKTTILIQQLPFFLN
jgi:hypothetical protein